MRILHTADWHLGKTLEGRSRLPEQEAFLDELALICRDMQIDLVLLAGDVYDTVNPPAAAEQLFYDSLSRLADQGQRSIAVIAGNHDNPDRLTAAWPLARDHGISLVGTPTAAIQAIDIARTQERALLYALPYPSESRLSELLSDEADEDLLRLAYSKRVGELAARHTQSFSDQTVNLLMSHLYVMGGVETDSERPIQVGGAYTVDTSALCTGAQYVALGHLHRPQSLKPPENAHSQPIIRYSGSPLAYSFSEAGQAKSVTVIEAAPGGAVQMEEVLLQCGKPLVRWKATGGIEQVHRWLDEGKDLDAWIDLEVYLTESLSMEQLHRLRKWHSGIIHIRPIYPEMAEEEKTKPRSGLPIDELFRRFYRNKTGGAEPENELVQLFLELVSEEPGNKDEAVEKSGE